MLKMWVCWRQACDYQTLGHDPLFARRLTAYIDGMTATLHWNRLSIEADGDAAFKKDVSANFGKLVDSPYPDLEIDLGRCVNVGEDGFKAIGPMIVDAAGNKQVTVRVSEPLRRFFEGSGLSGLVKVSVIEHMDGTIKQGKDEDSLEPVDDEEEEREEKEETHPPSGDIHSTKIQTKATGGCMVDEEDGKRFLVGEEIVIGREPPSNPVFAIPTISKRHFRIFRQGPGYFIEDMRSTNGTYLNGNPLTQPQPLAEGDEIVVAITLKHPEGARRFKFTMK